jgi:hypothetical protein
MWLLKGLKGFSKDNKPQDSVVEDDGGQERR